MGVRWELDEFVSFSFFCSFSIIACQRFVRFIYGFLLLLLILILFFILHFVFPHPSGFQAGAGLGDTHWRECRDPSHARLALQQLRTDRALDAAQPALHEAAGAWYVRGQTLHFGIWGFIFYSCVFCFSSSFRSQFYYYHFLFNSYYSSNCGIVRFG
jgi:hypothetical protein